MSRYPIAKALYIQDHKRVFALGIKFDKMRTSMRYGTSLEAARYFIEWWDACEQEVERAEKVRTRNKLDK